MLGAFQMNFECMSRTRRMLCDVFVSVLWMYSECILNVKLTVCEDILNVFGLYLKVLGRWMTFECILNVFQMFLNAFWFYVLFGSLPRRWGRGPWAPIRGLIKPSRASVGLLMASLRYLSKPSSHQKAIRRLIKGVKYGLNINSFSISGRPTRI